MQVNINQLEIPKASAYAAKAMEIISSENPDLKKLEAAIMHDPLLASSLLRYANSPLHRRASEVSNVPTALRLLGLKSVKSAIVTATIRSILPADSQVGLIILSHMLNISAISKLIAQKCCAAVSDDLEFLGLVHDVGMLTLAANYERTYEKIITDAQQKNNEVDQLEREEFGISHNIVTAKTAEEFRLPKKHCELLMTFHTREAINAISDDLDRDYCVLSLAHYILREIDDSNHSFLETVVETEEKLVQLLDLDQEQLDNIKQSAIQAIAANAQPL